MPTKVSLFLAMHKVTVRFIVPERQGKKGRKVEEAASALHH